MAINKEMSHKSIPLELIDDARKERFGMPDTISGDVVQDRATVDFELALAKSPNELAANALNRQLRAQADFRKRAKVNGITNPIYGPVDSDKHQE